MSSLHVSITQQLKDWVESKTQSGEYANNSDYIRDLIRKDKARSEKIGVLNAAIQQGIESGDAGPLDMKAIKQLAKQKVKENR